MAEQQPDDALETVLAASAKHRAALERIAAASEATQRQTAAPVERSRMTIPQKAAFIREHGMEKYLLLPWGKQ